MVHAAFAALALLLSARCIDAFEGYFALTPPDPGDYRLISGQSAISLGKWTLMVGSGVISVSTVEPEKLRIPLRQVSTQPFGGIGITVPEPGTISFTYTITATGANPSCSFGWSKEPGPLQNPITEMTVSPQTGLFEVEDGDVFMFQFGGSSCEIVIDSFSFTPRGVKPTFTKHPESKLLKVAGTLKLEVAAKGTAPIEFQWYRESEPIEGGTSETLLKTDLIASDSGGYYCVASNLYGSSTSHVAQVSVDFLSARLFPSLVVDGAPGERFRVEFRDKATPSQEWQPIAEITLESNREIWIDENYSASQRFYRAVLLAE